MFGDEDVCDVSDDGLFWNVLVSGYMFVVFAFFRDRVDDVRAAFGVAVFEKCWCVIVSKMMCVIVDCIVCVVMFFCVGVK